MLHFKELIRKLRHKHEASFLVPNKTSCLDYNAAFCHKRLNIILLQLIFSRIFRIVLSVCPLGYSQCHLKWMEKDKKHLCIVKVIQSFNNLEYLDQKLDRLHPYIFTFQLSKCKESKDTANNYEDTGNMTALISGKNNFVAKGELDKLDILQSLKRNEKIIFKTDTKEECFSHCSLE